MEKKNGQCPTKTQLRYYMQGVDGNRLPKWAVAFITEHIEGCERCRGICAKHSDESLQLENVLPPWALENLRKPNVKESSEYTK